MASGLPTDEFFTIRYEVTNGVTPVAATYRTEEAGDIMSTVFQNAVTRTAVFGDGFSDPTAGAGMQETYSIFNPYSTDSGVSSIYSVLFHFSDGTTLWWNHQAPLPPSLGPWERVDIRPQDAEVVTGQAMTVWEKINSAPQFRFYSVEIVSAQLNPGIVGGIVAQRTRLQNNVGQSITSVAGLDARLPVLYLNNPEFA
jgi:hypothetical protein